MDVIYIFLLLITIISFSFLVPVVFAMKKLRKKVRTQMSVPSQDEGDFESSRRVINDNMPESKELNAEFLKVSTKLRFRFRIFLLVGLVDLIVLFVTFK